MLNLLVGQIANPYRPHATVTCQCRDLVLVQFDAPINSVNRLQGAALSMGCNIDDVGNVALHGAGRTQAIECVDHEIAISQPTITVVPIADAASCLRDGGRHSRNDSAGVVVGVELQGNCGADHLGLPFKWNRQVANPLPPILCGFVQKPSPDFAGRFADGFVRAQHKRYAVIEEERCLLQNCGQGCIGCQSQRERWCDVSNVVAAPCHVRSGCTVVACRAHTQCQTRTSSQSSNAAHQHHGVKRAVVMAEPGSKVGYLNSTTVTVVQARYQDSRVFQIVLLCAFTVRQING
ncbi:hypothetical protein GALL_539130 [mine drainage metagenome]|uniref:Uncharacterized protein n=1 Tax=mine drainage metagenome TaxID=410659 RepID=A0A1J5P1R5_9ZZZZ